MLTELQGQLERITYHNRDSHYTVAKLKVQGTRNLVTIVGNLVYVSLGEMLKLKGSWDVHPRYGEQFRVVSYEVVVPATAKGIERYLGSGLIKGIGPVMAKRLVQKFGDKTLDVIENDADRLREAEGIGSKRIDMIRTAWADQKEVREVMLFLQGHEVSAAYAARIYKQYGRNSISVVKDNPYRLAEDIFGVGFLTADKIAMKLGVPKDSLKRAAAGILYVLNKLSDEGHVCFPYEPLLDECGKILETERDIIIEACRRAVEERKIIVEETGEAGDTGRTVYLAGLHAAETGVAEHIRTVFTAPGKDRLFDKDRSLEWVQKELNINLADGQKSAIRMAMEKKVLVITGGPGTGKTTLIRAILKIYRRSGRNVLMAAPTGRAAKRMSEATGFEAKTIHRLLEFSPKQGDFRKNEEYPLETDLVVIDEASMVDTILMHSLLKAVPRDAVLVLVGDVDQLPSVGAGNVLKDIIDSGYIPTVRLNEIFRQASQSLIIVNAHRINNGEFPLLPPDREELRDFYFIQLEDPEEVCRMVLNMCKNRIPEKFGLNPVKDIQVLSPMHRGVAGASNLNIELQKFLNNSQDEFSRGGKTLKTGDKVMQIRNNYDKDVFNGDIGVITSIDKEEQELTVDYDGRRTAYDFSELDEIVLAYAVSVHKSQGSEYPAVVLPLLTQHYMMLQRNLLYTAVTRGKKLVVIIGTKKALAMSIKNNKQQMRYTRLKERLREIMPH
ncbi:Similar to exodeoxyribonuclease V alpha subunit [Candidatus Sulfobium mesophilum]|uniref:Similar to exodeoxyribonuclease V alpha subunit n=1 Tax=Candidatus Sulfobium mesophilum TaxID=2016548 RepID=A0A2U3QFC5_9BACT|nr:Similar to exodeoxyribonuclease V alpha subunit [Candidatus Sulfobium mesophilum]